VWVDLAQLRQQRLALGGVAVGPELKDVAQQCNAEGASGDQILGGKHALAAWRCAGGPRLPRGGVQLAQLRLGGHDAARVRRCCASGKAR